MQSNSTQSNSESKKLRVGILTGGGDCPGLNAVIRAVAKNLILSCNAEVIGIEEGFLGLIERKVRPLNYQDVSGILTQGGTILGTNNKANPFQFYGRNGADISDEVIAYYHELGLDAIVVIGGDGTMSMSHQLALKGMNIVGVPKTIDNDLVGTERTFGFDTAVGIATEALDRLHSTAQSHQRVLILETMGRYAGWIALHAGLASGSDIILIPEFEYDIEEVARVCRKREQGGQRFTIIAVAEGAKPKAGSMIVRERDEDSPDPIRLGGISRYLAEQLKGHIESDIRTMILGHIQRGGTPSAFDRVLATALGSYAAGMIENKQYNRLVALQENRMTSVPLSEVANKTRLVRHDSMLVASALGIGTSFGVTDLEVDLLSAGAAGSVT